MQIHSTRPLIEISDLSNVAHDEVDAGSPIKMGGRAQDSERTAVADADRVDAWFDTKGRLIVAPWHPGELTPATATLTATTDASIIAAPGAGQALYVCSVLITNTSATLTRVDLKDGSGGTVRVTGAAAASGGGFMWRPIRPWKLTANTGLFGALGTAVTDVRAVIEYFTAPP